MAKCGRAKYYKESRMIYVCVKFSCTQKSSSFYYCPPLPRGITRNENEIEWKISLWKKWRWRKIHTHTQMKWEGVRDKGSDDHLSRLCVILPFYAFIFKPFLCCPLQCANTFVSIPDKKKELILLNIIEFRWHLPLCFQCTRQPNMQNRLQHRTNRIGPSNGKANMEHSRTKCA